MRLLVLAAFSAIAFTAPILEASPIPESYAWQVTNWEAGCVRSGCYSCEHTPFAW
jgi:hypothetical protein